MIDATQAWFWTSEWQEGEREAAAELAAGGGRTYESDEAFLESLHEQSPLPTYTRLPRVDRDFEALTAEERRQFAKAVGNFIADLKAGA